MRHIVLVLCMMLWGNAYGMVKRVLHIPMHVAMAMVSMPQDSSLQEEQWDTCARYYEGPVFCRPNMYIEHTVKPKIHFVEKDGIVSVAFKGSDYTVSCEAEDITELNLSGIEITPEMMYEIFVCFKNVTRIVVDEKLDKRLKMLCEKVGIKVVCTEKEIEV